MFNKVKKWGHGWQGLLKTFQIMRKSRINYLEEPEGINNHIYIYICLEIKQHLTFKKKNVPTKNFQKFPNGFAFFLPNNIQAVPRNYLQNFP